MATNLPNICVTYASKGISGELNQKILSIEGRVDMERLTSVRAEIQRKYYIGSWRLCSTLTTARMVPFPRTVSL